jgi:hypothetical protein
MADLLTKVGSAGHGLRSGLVRAAVGDLDLGAIVSPDVIEPGELDRRMSAARSSQAAAASDVVLTESPTLEERAHRLHRLWATVAPQAIEPAPGPRGRAVFEAKRSIRRATSWYVEQRWHGQHEVDAETARFASDVAGRIAELQAHVAHLEERNDRLQREVRALRRDRLDDR